jgi:MSHA pilin protein MshD
MSTDGVRRGSGFTLIELVIMIGVVSIAMAATMAMYANVVRHSADPYPAKQALAIAEGLLEEAQLNSYTASGGAGWPSTLRANYDDVDDYNGYTSTGYKDINDTAVLSLAAFNVSIVVTTPGLNGVATAKLITVTVTGPGNVSIVLSGYRVQYP